MDYEARIRKYSQISSPPFNFEAPRRLKNNIIPLAAPGPSLPDHS